MANYPPTPSFGGPFFAPQWPPPPGPHPSYQGEILPGPPPPLHTPSNHPFMPANPPSTTPQIPGLGGSNNVPLPPPPHFPPQYQHNPKFPPSPYFSGPPPQDKVPTFPQRQESRGSGYNGDSSIQPSGDERQEAQREFHGLSTFNNGGPSRLTETGTREEGELSDGELDRSPLSIDKGLVQNQGSSFSNKRHRPDEDSPKINSEGAFRQPARSSEFPRGRKDASINSNLEKPRAKIALGDGNGSIHEQSATFGRDFRDFSQISTHASTMQNSNHGQNPDGGSTFSGSHLPGLGATPINRNDIDESIGNGETPSRTLNRKSPTQLRVMAQGALLGLAPHNVRYHELVDEGIDPIVLRRLYEDIGIKITPGLGEGKSPTQAISPASTAKSTEEENYTPPEPSAEVMESKPSPSSQAISSSENALNAPVPEPGTLQESERNEAQLKLDNSPATVPSSATASNKPLERKDLIARMLAAKAKKPTPNETRSEKERTSSQPHYEPKSVEKHNGIPSSKPTIAANDVNAQPTRSTETLLKEKNKAQTELARQRMEQLKKQGLVKSNRHVNADSTSVSPPPQPQSIDNGTPEHILSESSSETPQESLNYPLPDRPPLPESGSQSRIPGLFMTSSDQSITESKDSTTANNCAQLSPVSRSVSKSKILPRKRPVASDFTDEPASTAKKPFHHEVKAKVPESRVIIDISEDESMYDAGDDIMDIDEEPDKNGKSSILNGQQISNQSHDDSSTEVLSKTPTKTASRQGMQTTPTSKTPVKGNDQEVLRQKQVEIQAMRKRIAEFEKRHKAKQTASRTQSPGTQPHPISSPLETPLEPHEKPLSIRDKGIEPHTGESSNVKPKPLTTEAKTDLNSSADQVTKFSPSISSPARARASLDPTNLDDMRQKVLRKKEIESGLPLLEAELLKYEQKLADFRKEEEKILAEITKGREGKRQLIAELENLGIETEGLSTEELQATKDSLTESGNLDNGTDAPAPIQSPHDPTPASEPSNIGGDAVSEAKDPQVLPPDLDAEGLPRDDTMTHQPAFETIPSVSQDVLDRDVQSSIETGKASVGVEEANDRGISSSSSMDESMSSSRSISVDEPILAHAPAPNDDSTPMISEHPNFNDNSASVTIPSHTDYVSQSDNSQSMSGISESAVETSEPIHQQSTDACREGSVDSDAYEPPEPDQATEKFDTVSSPPFSPASPRSVEAASAAMPSVSVIQDDEALTERIQEPAEEPQVTGGMVESQTQPVSSRHFTPYVSPLKQFNAYRYHPSYVNDVHEGYRSLTYSHDIDPDKYLCVFEASGGICKDDSCVYQHFRDMHLSDDKILVQMGSLREGKTAQEKEEYIAGLKKIISDMRREKVKDFNTVATEIAAYRRRFLEDPSRILPL